MLLKSREVIAINQDPLGVAGDRVWKQGPHEVCCSCIYSSPVKAYFLDVVSSRCGDGQTPCSKVARSGQDKQILKALCVICHG